MKTSTRSLRAFRNVSACAALTATLLLGVSCTPKSEEDIPTDVIETPSDVIPEEDIVVEDPIEVRVGKIMGVGESGRFVVVALDQGSTVETGDTLKARFAGAQTAVLKVSPERQGNLVTADVVAGTPAKDHEVVK